MYTLLYTTAHVVQVRCVAEAVYRQDATQIQDICGVTNIRDQRAVPRKVNVSAECRPPRSSTESCYDTVLAGRDDALGVCLVIDTNLAFVAMCLAAACGHHEVVEVIGNAGQNRELILRGGREGRGEAR